MDIQGDGDPMTIMAQTTCQDDNYYSDNFGWCDCDYDYGSGLTICLFMSDNCGGRNPYC